MVIQQLVRRDVKAKQMHTYTAIYVFWIIKSLDPNVRIVWKQIKLLFNLTIRAVLQDFE